MNLTSVKKLGFRWYLEHYGADGKLKSREELDNLLPNESIAYLMNAGYTGGAQLTSFYIGLYEGAYTPLVTDTLTTLLAATTECTKYAAGARMALTGALASGLFSNVLSPALFVFNADVIVRGGFITNNAVWNNTAGVLHSAVLFPTVKDMKTGDTLKVTAGNGLITT